MSSNGKIIVGRRSFWLAWYPRRGRRCQVRIDSVERYFEVAFGPLYFCVGPGLAPV
jgi:hypothetical protein